MDREFAQFEALESAIREFGEADRAGVFGRTRVDARALTQSPVPANVIRPAWLRRLSSVAAVLLIACGVWGWMFVDQIGKLRSRANPGLVINPPPTRPAILAHLTGPSVASAETSDDFDADGDLDLADYRTFQLQYSVTR